ncbi:MAG: HAD family hydrolase [Clostridiales bacterium]|jgi:HAD superfamily hydrolase (TIGR01509 family)|nr:HAD family hydrolase [Clostridiales bacterium]
MESAAYIFDMDGVLIDSQPLHFEADRSTLRACGVTGDLGFVTSCAGMATAERMALYKEKFNVTAAVKDMIATSKRLARETFAEAPLCAIPGIENWLAALRGQGMPLAVASSTAGDLIRIILKRTGLAGYFDIIVSGEDLPRSKPHPDVFLLAAKLLGVAPERCTVVEDSSNGVLAAKRAGMRCVGYRNPNSGEQDLSLADTIVYKYDV